MIQMEMIKTLPKVELHCHLDGSLSDRALEIIMKQDESGSSESFEALSQRLRAPANLADLAEYLSCFDFVLPYLQNSFALQTAAYELIRQAAADQVIYQEVRFAPQLHCQRELDQRAAVKAVLSGLELGERDFGVKSRAILCLMRGAAEAVNQQTLEIAKELQSDGVGGVDLAGNEAAYPPELYRDFFDQAGKWQLPYTIHAGECGSAANVKMAIAMGATRIGHGVAIANDEQIKALCRKEQIVLEMCPISNLQTKAVKAAADYPFAQMQQEGVAVTVNTDNRTVSDTTLRKEWQFLADQAPHLDQEALVKSGYSAIDGAFLPAAEKQALRAEFAAKIRR